MAITPAPLSNMTTKVIIPESLRQPCSETRSPAWDIFRGVSILAVLGIHLSGHFLSISPLGTPLWCVLATLNRALQFAVPGFLMLSAFLNMQALLAHPNLNRYARRRIAQTLYPYFIWSGFAILLTHRHALGELSARQILGLLLWGKAYFHLYFLVLAFQLYLILPLLMPIFRRRPPFWKVAASAVSLQITVYLLNHFFWKSPHLGTTIFWYVPSIALGLWAGGQAHRLRELRQRGMLPAAILTVVCFAIYCPVALTALFQSRVDTQTFQFAEWGYTAGASFLLLFASEALKSSRVSAFLSFLGARSLPIYLVHPFVILLLDRSLHFASHLPIAILLPIYGIACFGMPLLLNKLVAQGPISQALFGRQP